MNGYLTDAGRALEAKLLTGTSLQITKILAGSGTTPLDATSLSAPRQTLHVNSAACIGSKAVYSAMLLCGEAEQDYAVKEIGVYARDPKAGEILYRIYRLDTPYNVAAGRREALRVSLEETVSEGETVVVEGSSAGVLTEAIAGCPGGVATLNLDGVLTESQRPYTYGTADLIAGESELATGRLYFVYEE